ncbi:MAG: DivIVA domain-containing protein [Balneolaceae bacterium]
MKLTALEIKQQSFEKSLRGYDTAEVHAFLNLVASEWEHMVGKTRELEIQIEKMNEKLKHYERVEQALHETLQTAKDSADQKLSGARQESKNIIEKAEMEADSIIKDASMQRQQIRQSILRLLDRRKEIVGGIRSYLELAQESLQQFSKDEASLFSLPKEEEFENTLNHHNDYLSGEDLKSKRKRESSESVMHPGTENMDDILDNID